MSTCVCLHAYTVGALMLVWVKNAWLYSRWFAATRTHTFLYLRRMVSRALAFVCLSSFNLNRSHRFIRRWTNTYTLSTTTTTTTLSLVSLSFIGRTLPMRKRIAFTFHLPLVSEMDLFLILCTVAPSCIQHTMIWKRCFFLSYERCMSLN